MGDLGPEAGRAQDDGRRLCLVMIVRNEAAVLGRCLASVRSLVDYWVVCDTGSTDQTVEVLQCALAGIPGELHRDPWTNFGHNRTLALQRARGKADYHLLLDADMTVNVGGEFRNQLSDDAYLVRHEGDNDYWVERLVSDRHAWEYHGVTHEYIRSDTANGCGKLRELTVTHHEDGGCRADKYERDIKLLREGLQAEPENGRYVFYLAQSYRDIGNLTQALEWYEKRATMGGWDEEVWYALYQVARLRHRLGYAWPLVLEAYLEAYQLRPARLEPLYYLARAYRERDEPDVARLFARRAREIPYPEDILFIERPIYERLMEMEYAACFPAGNPANPLG